MAIALAYLDPGQLGGALQANSTGWDWYFVTAFRDASTGKKDVINGVHAVTLDTDTLSQVAAKIGAAIKAEGTNRGYSVTNVLLPTFQLISV